MRKRTTLLAVGGMVLSLLAPTSSAQAGPFQAPPPGSIDIRLVTVNGTGCPDARTGLVAVAPDKTAFTVTYRSHHYIAQVGPATNPTASRVNCQLTMAVHVPQGFTYAIAKADYSGYARLAKSASGLEQASYYFQGQPNTTRRRHQITGPKKGNFAFTDKIAVGALVWAPCGVDRNVNVNTELRVNAGSSHPSKNPSYLRMGSTDGRIKSKFNLSWKRCR